MIQSPIVALFGRGRSTVVKPPFSAASLALTAANISACSASFGPQLLEVTTDVKPTDWEHLSKECSNEVANDAKPSDWEHAPASSPDGERCG